MSGRKDVLAVRRRLLVAYAGLPLAGALPALGQNAKTPLPSANEELMQEHGLVGRVFGVYRAAIGYLQGNQQFDPQLVVQAARMVREVIHEHHEQEEEKTLFPRVRHNASAEMTNLIAVLIGQHRAARALTAAIEKQPAIEPMQKFIAMYEPHGAFENTLVYPAFRKSLSPAEYGELSRRFAEPDFGKHTAALARIETLMGVSLAEQTEQKQPKRS